MRGMAGWIALTMAVAVSACGTPDPSENTAWLRTYPAREQTLCTLSLAADPVVGTFDGDVLAPGDKSWLVDADGQRLYVVWPQGFTLAFEPGPTLRDENGQVIAQQDVPVALLQVNRFDHAGTPGDPYLALGSLPTGCYSLAS